MRRGVLAIGDSITNACSKDLIVDGVPPRSWAEWVSEASGQPLRVYARPGASSSAVRCLIPDRLDRYAIGLVYVGVNNAISWRWWRRDDLRRDLEEILARVSFHCEIVAVMQLPTSLGCAKAITPYGPFLRRRVTRAQNIVCEVAAEANAVLIQNTLTQDQVWIDGVHPTSSGHLAMGNAALRALGMPQVEVTDRQVPRPDFNAWRRMQQARFFVRQPLRGIGAWLFGR